MGRKRALLYEVLGNGQGSLSRKRPSTAAPRRSGRRPRRARPSGVWRWRWRVPPRVIGSAAAAILVLTFSAYYIGSLSNDKSKPAPGLLRSVPSTAVGRKAQGMAPEPAPREWWAVQVITYKRTAQGRKRAEELILELERRGFDHVYCLVGRRYLEVVVGQARRLESLDDLLGELQQLEIRGTRPFRQARTRHVKLPD